MRNDDKIREFLILLTRQVLVKQVETDTANHRRLDDSVNRRGFHEKYPKRSNAGKSDINLKKWKIFNRKK